jgi:tRNA 2-thiocytidine biosynthesis protein TtcA
MFDRASPQLRGPRFSGAIPGIGGWARALLDLGPRGEALRELEQLTRELSRDLGRCMGDFQMLRPDDRVMVCLSGGKDSYTMLHLLERLRQRAPFKFSLIAVHLDQGQPGYDGEPLARYLREHGYEHKIVREDTYSVVKENVPEGKTYCSLCSRLRRGVLYNVAQDLGCTKLALGHHRDDAIETLLLNLMFTGSLRALPPKLISDDGRNTVIRPLMYAAEKSIARFSELMEFPILPCNLCGSQEQLMRKQVKRFLTELEQHAPRARQSMLAAMTNVRPSQLLDRELWSALGLPVAADASQPTTALGPEDDGPKPDKLRLPVL